MTESDRIKRALTDFEAYARKNLNLRTRAVPARWTEGIMTRLCKGGQDADNSVRVKGIDEAEGGEWLYDMVWLQNNGRGQLIDVKLVLECEAEKFRDYVVPDFRKMLLAKSELRCMIFRAADKQTAKSNVRSLVSAINMFHRTECEDNYLFCVWLKNESRFYFDVYPSNPVGVDEDPPAKGLHLGHIKKLYLDYWTALKNHFEQRDKRNDDIKFRKPLPQCFMAFAVGRSDFHIHMWASRDKRYVNVGLTVQGIQGKSHFDRLKMSKTEIESEIGAELEWQENPKQNYIRLYLRNIDLTKQRDWGRQHRWLCEQLETFYRVFSERIKAL